jgi:hypothetical protein
MLSGSNTCTTSTTDAISANTLVDIILTTSGKFNSGEIFAIALTCQ